jgi:hypothetical protein
MHLIVFANPLENDFATSVNGGLTKLQSAISPEVPVHLPCLDGVA